VSEQAGVVLARKPSKTVVQPDQYELFARKIRAQFADLSTIGKISLSLTLAMTMALVTILSTTAEDFWLRPALMGVRLV
jgi:hypothetical protein